MNQRVEHPPFEERESLTNKLNEGELATWEALRDGLSPEWEIYAQSHILDVMPDFVLVNPEKGVFIVEVKDVDLSSRRPEWIANEVDSARSQAVRYRNAIHHLPGRVGLLTGGALRACVVFTRTTVVDADRLIPGRLNGFTLVFAGVEVAERMIKAIEATSIQTTQVDSPAFEALCHFLVEPEFVREQRELPVLSALSPKQREIVMNPEGVTRRRVKGGAGSGKTIVLAARAAELAKNPDCRILVICFNRSLVTYLRDTIAEYTRRSGGDRKAITIYHWEQWWSDSFRKFDETDQSVPVKEYRRVARQVLGDGNHLPRFDAVLIDEAQDLSPDQIGALTTVLRDGNSELLACFDGAQDVYENSDVWADGDAFGELGFKGKFFQLKENRRMPPRVAMIANHFAKALLNVHVENLLDVPVMETLEQHVAELKWIQCDDLDLVTICISEVDALFDDGVPRSRDLVAWADLVIASRLRETALKLKSVLEEKGLKVICAVDGKSGSPEDRNAKTSFYKGDGRIKVSTIKSLKGFETTATVIAVEPFETPDAAGALREVYTALTRLKGRTGGSSLVVVCAEPSLREFGDYFNQVR
jgi:hypothetical protein